MRPPCLPCSFRRAAALAVLGLLLVAACTDRAEAKSNNKNSGGGSPPPSSGGGTKKQGGGLMWLLLLLLIPGLLLFCCALKMLGCICGGAAAVKKQKADQKKFKEVKESEAEFLSGALPGPLLGAPLPPLPGGMHLPGKGGAATWWVGSYTEDGAARRTDYYLAFSPEGAVSGTGHDQDGQFNVSGRYNPTNGRVAWAEDITSAGVQVAVQLQGLPHDPEGALSRMQGTYCGTTGVFGPMELSAGDGVEMAGMGAPPVVQATAPPPGNYYPPPPAGYPPADTGYAPQVPAYQPQV
mmetsp:Transcript_33372/g.84050  ORF Transcript_33372/g.84050 Transcript_33372/m.84050 type:complete len:295 (+) Transcript_33372:199-1083(+)|eukprot:jgi/Tetstr1/447950/TSEL_035255.t1